MSRGILSGIAWGAAGGTALLTVLSLYTPLPSEKEEAQQSEVDAVQSQVPQTATTAAQSDGPAEPVAPEEVEITSETTEEPETASVSAVQQGDVGVPEDTQDIAQDTTQEVVVTVPEEEEAPVVQTQAPEAAVTVQEAENIVAPAARDAEITSLEPQAPSLSESEVAVTPLDNPAQPVNAKTAAPETPQAPSALASSELGIGEQDIVSRNATSPDAPLQPETDAVPQADDAAPSQSVVVETAQASRPRIVFPKFDTSDPDEPAADLAEPEVEATEVSSDTPIILPAPEPKNPVAGVVTGRLPSVTGPVNDESSSEDDAALATPASEETGQGALQAYAATVDPAPEGALFSIVLIDAGDTGVPIAELSELGLGFSVAIDPVAPSAAARAAEYRAGGIEVLALPNDLPEAAGPSDVAVAMEGYFGILNESIGVLDPLDARIQGNRSLLEPVLGALQETGHAIVTYDQGLNSAQQAARREGIPAGTIYRLLDLEGEAAPRIKRYLDRASFNASRDGSVIVLGHTYPETVKALIEWALEKSGDTLSVVPVSQVLLSGEG